MKPKLYLTVMGTLGSGKTTVAKLLSKRLNLQLIEENFGENAFLPRFYKDMKAWAFHSQTFFLMEKISQMFLTKDLLNKSDVIQDTPLYQDVFSYAKAQHVLGNMDDAEWKLYRKIYNSFADLLPVPGLIVYLDVNMENIRNRISGRGRSYEMDIPDSYLELLDMLNHKFISENKHIPVLTIDTNGLNITRNQKARETLVDQVRRKLKI